VTMVEHGGYGGVAAAPVSAEVIRAWYTKNKNNSGSDYAAVK